jgi:uncharacterized protein
MEFNKVVRGAKREMNDENSVYSILDAGFLCHVAFQHEGQTMMIPTAYGRKGDSIYLHGSAKNFMLNQILNGQTICVSVTHLDGIVLAKSLFDTSVNYRSVVLFGKAILLEDEAARMEGLKIITENIIEGRWDEVPTGTPQQLKATMVLEFSIERASAKIRNEGPMGDDTVLNNAWSGHIPLITKALEPITDTKFTEVFPLSGSAKKFYEENK